MFHKICELLFFENTFAGYLYTRLVNHPPPVTLAHDGEDSTLSPVRLPLSRAAPDATVLFLGRPLLQNRPKAFFNVEISVRLYSSELLRAEPKVEKQLRNTSEVLA